MERIQKIKEILYRCLVPVPKNVWVQYRTLRTFLNNAGSNVQFYEIKAALCLLRNAKLLNFIEENDYEICIIE